MAKRNQLERETHEEVNIIPYETICSGCGTKQEILEVIYSRGCPNCGDVLFQDISESGQVIRVWQFNFSDKRLDYMTPNPIAVWSVDF